MQVLIIAPLGTVRASVPLADGRRAEIEIVCGVKGHGVAEVSLDGRALDLRPRAKAYRQAGVAVRMADLKAGGDPVRVLVTTR